MPGAAKPRPILKWAGGKARVYPLAKQAGLIPPAYGRYWEAFAGGVAFFFAEEPKQATLIDTNEELFATYQVVKEDVESLVALLAEHRKQHSEAFFYAIRSQAPEELTPLERAARMIYLNKTCFNGLYRVNARGQFNVPFGRYTNPPILDADNLRAASRTLQRAELRLGDFSLVLDGAKAGDFAYLDPPYDPVSATSNFTGYTKESFGRKDQERLRDVFVELSKRGVHCLLSNSDTPFIRDLYAGFHIETISVSRAINSKGDKRGPVGEVLVATGKWSSEMRRVGSFANPASAQAS